MDSKFKRFVCSLILDYCQRKDNDLCLQESPEWGTYATCINSDMYCESYAKDMKRCCPETCNSSDFTQKDCKHDTGSGTCIYSNSTNCEIKGNLYFIVKPLISNSLTSINSVTN